jgi:hypothetical protein
MRYLIDKNVICRMTNCTPNRSDCIHHCANDWLGIEKRQLTLGTTTTQQDNEIMTITVCTPHHLGQLLSGSFAGHPGWIQPPTKLETAPSQHTRKIVLYGTRLRSHNSDVQRHRNELSALIGSKNSFVDERLSQTLDILASETSHLIVVELVYYETDPSGGPIGTEAPHRYDLNIAL